MKLLQTKTNSSEVNPDFKVKIFPIKFYEELKANYSNKNVKSVSIDEPTNNIFNFSLVLIPIKKNETIGLAVSIHSPMVIWFIFLCFHKLYVSFLKR